MPPGVTRIFLITITLLGSAAVLWGMPHDSFFMMGLGAGVACSALLLALFYRERRKPIVTSIPVTLVVVLSMVGIPALLRALGTQGQHFFYGIVATATPLLLVGALLIQDKR